MIIEKLTVGPMGVNCYIVWDEKTAKAAIIDPGYTDPRVAQTIKDNNLKVEKIILTHGHIDHLLGLDEARSLTDAEVYIHEADASCLTSAAHSLSDMMGLHKTFAPAEHTIKDGDVISVGGEYLTVIHTPGHTVGSVCLLTEKGDTLFSGDTLFQSSIGRTDFPGGSYETIIKSLTRLMTLPDTTRVLTGHGEDTTIAYEKSSNPFITR